MSTLPLILLLDLPGFTFPLSSCGVRCGACAAPAPASEAASIAPPGITTGTPEAGPTIRRAECPDVGDKLPGLPRFISPARGDLCGDCTAPAPTTFPAADAVGSIGSGDLATNGEEQRLRTVADGRGGHGDSGSSVMNCDDCERSSRVGEGDADGRGVKPRPGGGVSSPISAACICMAVQRGERLPLPMDVPETDLLTGVTMGLTLLLRARGESRAPLGACVCMCVA